MHGKQKFSKVLMLLDRGQIERGEQLLRGVIEEAETENDQITLIRGLVVLGELLCEVGRSTDATPFLQRATSLEGEDDMVAVELERAKKLLAPRAI